MTELASISVGSRVVRGPDWSWGDQDGGLGHVGTVVTIGRLQHIQCPPGQVPSNSTSQLKGRQLKKKPLWSADGTTRATRLFEISGFGCSGSVMSY